MTTRFYGEYREFANQFYRDVVAAIKLISTNPKKAALILEADAGGSAAQFKQWIRNAGDRLHHPPARPHADGALHEPHRPAAGRMPSAWTELVFPPVLPTKGS